MIVRAGFGHLSQCPGPLAKSDKNAVALKTSAGKPGQFLKGGAWMGRSGYHDGCEGWDLIRWRGAVASCR